MPILSITKNWRNGQPLTESMLDDIKTDTETFFNTTKLDSANFQGAAFVTASYQSASVNTTALATGAATTAKINNAAVTAAKLAPLGHQLSSSSSTFSTTSTSYVDVTNLSCTISTNGRPVYIALVPDGSSSPSAWRTAGADTNGESSSTIKLLRNTSTTVGIIKGTFTNVPRESGTNHILPLSAVQFIDIPASGTHTYQIQIVTNTSVTAEVLYAKLLVYEL